MTTTVIFGSVWDAPVCEDDNLEIVPTPVGDLCLDCDKPILDGENGQMVPSWNGQDDVRRRPIHKECLLLSVAGHSYEICRCTNYGGTGTRRSGAILLWDRVTGANR